MNRFGTTFADQLAEIALLRDYDAQFDEVCRDYEMLLGLLPRDAQDPVLPDIRESLAGLEAEISAMLSGRLPEIPNRMSVRDGKKER